MSTQAKRHGIFSVDNPKTLKGESMGYMTLILHFSPSNLNSRRVDLCPYASQECRDLCLNKAGLSAILPSIEKARIKKTDKFLENRELYLKNMIEEIHSYKKKAKKENLILVVRLNGTSDLNWSKIHYQKKNIFEWFHEIQFYDYTKSPYIAAYSQTVENYHVAFSWSGHNQETCLSMLENGLNVAVPFANVKKGKPLPSHFMGFPVIDGDKTDLRFLDKKPCIIGLRVKGNKQRKASENNFLVQIERIPL